MTGSGLPAHGADVAARHAAGGLRAGVRGRGHRRLRLRHARPDPRVRARPVVRALDFYRREHFLRAGDELHRIDVPQDVDLDVHREWLLVRNRSAWAVGGTTYPAGCLLAADVDAWMAGERDVDGAVRAGRAHVAAGPLLDQAPPDPDGAGGRRHPDGGADAAGRRLVAEAAGRGRRRSPAPTSSARTPTPATSTSSAPSGFLEPPTLRYGVVGDEAVTIKASPAFFDTDRAAR